MRPAAAIACALLASCGSGPDELRIPPQRPDKETVTDAGNARAVAAGTARASLDTARPARICATGHPEFNPRVSSFAHASDCAAHGSGLYPGGRPTAALAFFRDSQH